MTLGSPPASYHCNRQVLSAVISLMLQRYAGQLDSINADEMVGFSYGNDSDRIAGLACGETVELNSALDPLTSCEVGGIHFPSNQMLQNYAQPDGSWPLCNKEYNSE